MAGDQLLPAGLARVRSRNGAPWAALVLSAILLAVLASTGSGG
jgi:amino acid transporter